MKSRITLPKELRIIISPFCNLNCFYCHSEGIKKRNKQITKVDKNVKTLFKIFDSSNKIKEITITGGEPTLFPLELERLIRILKPKTNNLTLITNGTSPLILSKYSNYFTEIHLHVDVLEGRLRKKFMGEKSLTERKIKNLIKKINKDTFLRINSVTEDKYPIEAFLSMLLWCKENSIKIGFIKPLLKESKNFNVLKKIVSLIGYEKTRQKNIRKEIYKNKKQHIIEFILCRCDAFSKKNYLRKGKECINDSLAFDLSSNKISFCFLGKELNPNQFLNSISQFCCPLKKSEKFLTIKNSIDKGYKEYEVRFPCFDKDKIKKQLKTQGFVFKNRRRLCDLVYYQKGKNKIKVGDAVVRLRINKFSNNKVNFNLNIKEKLNRKEWLEWETVSIQNLFYLVSMLNKYFQPRMVLDRFRTTYLDLKKKTEVVIDEFENVLGNFIEIEGEKNEVDLLQKKLGLRNSSPAYGDIINKEILNGQINFTIKDFRNKILSMLRK